jgi:hypothetical protein
MADLKITTLPALAEAGIQATDPLAIADVSATETKKVTVKDLIAAGVALIDDGDIPAAKVGTLGTNQVATAAIQANAVTAAKIASGTITATEIADATITGAKLVNDTVTATQIAANAITASELADNAVDTAAIAANAVTTAKITDANVTYAKLSLSDGDIPGAKIATGGITATQLAANSVAASELADDAVDTAAIVDGAVTAVKIATNTITANQIAANAIGASELADNAVDTAAIVDGAVTAAKLSGTLGSSSIADSAVTTAKIADDAVTSAKLAANAVDAAALADNAVDSGAIASNAVIEAKIAANAVTVTKIADGTITPAKLNTSNLDRSLNVASGNLGINNTITAATRSGITYNAQGLITGTVALAAGDLPVATTSAVGGVSVGTGLSVSGAGALSLANSVTGATVSGITFNNQGMITAATALVAGDLPVATTSAKGAVQITSGGGLTVDGSGNLITSTSGVSAGTYQSVTVNNKGVITAGAALTAGLIPDLAASKITSGSLDAARIQNDSIDGSKLSNSSTAIFQSIAQSGYPTAQFSGQILFDTVSEDAYIWDGNAWQAITTLTKGSLVFGGNFNANTSKMTACTSAGLAAGLAVGSNLPTPSATTDGLYVVVDTAGTPSAPAPVVAFSPPDYILGVTNSAGSSWNEIDLSQTVAGQVASNITFTPYGQLSSTNVQDALQELETEKLALAGGTITGQVLIGNTGSLVFEGSTIDAYETTITVADPTSSDKTITFPDTTGTVITSGDTNTVTSTMVDASLVNANLAAGAAIAFSKLAALTSAQILVGNGSNVATAVAVTGDISINNAGLTAIAAGVIVDADISGSAAITGSKIATGTTSAVGVLQLTDSATSTSATTAATPAAVKIAKDAADAAATTANAALPKAGGTMTGNLILDNAKELRLSEGDSDGANYTGLKAQAQSGDITLTLPAVAPTAGQVLKANASTPTTLEWGTDSATDATKMPLAGGTFTGDVTFTGDSSNGLWDKSASAFVANLTGNVTGNVSGSAATVTGAAQSAITSLGTLTDLDVSSTSTSVIAGTSNTNVLSVRNTTEGNGTVGILMSTQNHASGREKAGIFHVETAGSAHYKGDLVFALNSANGSATQVSTADERMRITSAGKVGIGTTTPDTKLHVHNGSAGSIAAHANANLTIESSASDYSILQFLSPATATQQIRFGDPSDNGAGYIQYNHSSNALVFGANGPARMRIDSSGRLLVGTSTDQQGTGALLQVAATAGTAALSANRYTNTADGPSRLYLFKSRGTSIDAQTIVQDDDDIGEIVFHASDGTDATQAALIRAEVDGTPGNNDMPGRLSFHTTADGGHTPTERMRIDCRGLVGIGTTSPDYNMEIVGANPVLTIRDTETSQGSANARLRLAETGSSDSLDNYWDVAIDGQELKIIEGNKTSSTADTRLTIATDGNATFAGTVSDSKGNLRSIPSAVKNSQHALVASDAGKCLLSSSGGLVVNNSIMSAGDAVTFINNSSSDMTITINGTGSGLSLYNGATGVSGNKTLSAKGMATIWFAGADTGFISGAGLTDA